MSTRARVYPFKAGWQAECPNCPWLYWSRSMPAAFDEAWYHTCRPRLGPRPLPPGTAIDGIGAQLAVYVEPPTTHHHRMEPWL